jgi:serine protease Do
MISRISTLRASLVRVLVNVEPAGSGYVASSTGDIVTCFHVVQVLTPIPGQPGQAQVSYATNIEVETINGTRLPANIAPSCQGVGMQTAAAADFAILRVAGVNTPPLRLGSFDITPEGAAIYLGGFPFGIQQSVVAAGILSTKWQSPPHLGSGAQRDVGWLDITMNRGNSGGPVLRHATDPAGDEVIGVASFGLNPFAAPMEQIVQIAQDFTGTGVIVGVNIGQFATLVGSALAANSLGVGGCVAIKYAQQSL